MSLNRPAVITLLLALLAPLPTPAAQDAGALPTVVLLELKHLEETCRVLDAVAEKIWPGWNDYREVPFLLEYQNGLKILIGHPNPPKEFRIVAGVEVGRSRVFADRTSLIAKELEPPLAAGGGPIGFGSTADGRSVEVVHMRFQPAKQVESDGGARNTEGQILIYIHELFHCFQRGHIKNRVYGNLQYNADAEYALYSEIEGLALHRAYLEPDAEKAKLLIKDFLVARQLKRAATMSELQGNQESTDEFNEGTATYAEVRTLEALKAAGYTPGLTGQEDPAYLGFRDTGPMLKQYPDRLLKTAAGVEYQYSKSYTYGCFQALLCQRLFPGWQQTVTAGSGFIDAELAKRLPVTPEQKALSEQWLQENYPVAEIRARNAKYLNARDSAYNRMKSRAGKVYVLDFKATGQYLSTVAGKKDSYNLGLIYLYPDGLDPIKFDEVELSAITGPAEINQLYFIRTIDTLERKGAAPLKVEGVRQPDGSWKTAIVQTPLFTLKAPHVRIQESGNLIKIQVLARVK